MDVLYLLGHDGGRRLADPWQFAQHIGRKAIQFIGTAGVDLDADVTVPGDGAIYESLNSTTSLFVGFSFR